MKRSGGRRRVKVSAAGATHVFAAACRTRGVRFSFGFPVDERIQHIVGLIPGQCWHPAIEDGGLRDGAWVAEATGMIDLSSWPEGPAADLAQGTPAPRRPAHLHRRRRAPRHRVPHRHRPRRDPGPDSRAQASGLRNLPCRGREENSAWLEAVLAAADLVCWAKLICFAHVPPLARCEIAAFRYRVLHVAAQLTRSARQLCLRNYRTWRWAAQIAAGFHRLRAAFT